MADNHKPFGVGDLLEWRCPNFGLTRQWRVNGIHLGGSNQESVCELVSVSHSPSGEGRMMVPEALLRGLHVAYHAK